MPKAIDQKVLVAARQAYLERLPKPSLREVAQEFSVSAAKICMESRKEKWSDLRDAFQRISAETHSKLSDAQKMAVIGVSLGHRAGVVAQQIGISEGTLSRWRQTPEFQKALDEIFNEATKMVAKRMQEAASTALRAVEDILNDPNASTTDRLKAASIILRHIGL